MKAENMLSVGVDIGTSTSQLVFSELTVEDTAGYFSIPCVSIINKQVIYKSPIYPTPLIDRTLIDGDALEAIISKEYKTAGVTFGQVATGAVIITGESARKENSSMILTRMSKYAGDFVVATAGPDIESVIAGQGSGACRFSETNGVTTVNLDIGGGTTNVAVFRDGEPIAKGCLDIGGRQVIVENGRYVYISESAEIIAESRGISLKTGSRADKRSLEILCDAMNELLEELLGIIPRTEVLDKVLTRGASTLTGKDVEGIRYVCFSGGVADCIYSEQAEDFAYGDIGVLLGKAIRRGRIFSHFRVSDRGETIRATVIGAGTYTTSISGSTIAYADNVFPLKNVPVMKLDAAEEKELWSGKYKGLSEKITWFLSQNDTDRLVLSIEGRKNPEYVMVNSLAGAIKEAAFESLGSEVPILVIVREDIAKALGQALERYVRGQRAIGVIDEVRAYNNNYVDFGKPIMGGMVVPIVVKTLIFG